MAKRGSSKLREGMGVGRETSGKRILFVDDEASIRMTLPPVLQQAGFDVHVAESVGDAIFEINSHQFDALISDLNIGEEGDGFLVTSAMRHIQPNCVTFILTGYPAFETALQAIHSQVDDYLVKPVEVDSLISAVNDRLTNRLTKMQLPVSRLSTVLRENASRIVEAAINSFRGGHSEAEDRTGRDEVAKFFGIFVNSLAQQIDGESEHPSQEALRAATDFGKARARTKGASFAEMVGEFGKLENAVYDEIQRGTTTAEGASTLISDLKLLRSGLNHLLQQSLGAFAKAASAR